MREPHQLACECGACIKLSCLAGKEAEHIDPLLAAFHALHRDRGHQYVTNHLAREIRDAHARSQKKSRNRGGRHREIMI